MLEIAGFLNNSLVDGARKLEADDVMAVLFDAIGVKDEATARVAGYDNIENLRFHFLEKTMNMGGVHVMQDENLRKALMHEAELLTKATSPLADRRSEITRLKASLDEGEQVRGEALETEVTNAEIELAKLTDEQVVERIEAEIRNNPTKYPLFTKYYLNAD